MCAYPNEPQKILRWALPSLVCLSASAFEFNRIPAGLIKGARVSRVSDTAIKMGVGYGENMGSYWETIATDAQHHRLHTHRTDHVSGSEQSSQGFS